MSHTPGPWVVSGLSGVLIYAPSQPTRGIPRPIASVSIRSDASEAEDDISYANARLIAASPELLEMCKELRVAVAAAMRVIAGIDAMSRVGAPADSYAERFVDEMHISGVKDGIGVRAETVIAKAEGKETT